MKNISISLHIPKIALSLLVLGGLIVFSSCEDILKEMPKQVVEENFYTNAADVETAVNAAYQPFRGGGFTGNYTAIIDAHNDWGYGRGSRAVLNNWQGLNTTWINGVGTMWDGFYRGIRNANLVIRNAPTGLSQGQTEVNQFVAEAKFLRAYFYFQLVRNWGGVPLRTEANMEQKDLARSSVEQVYDLMVSDLLEAETVLPNTQSQIGRPTKYSAKTMLADVYMHRNQFPEARTKAKEVIDANMYSLVPVQTSEDFWNIFGPDVLTTPEEIWYVKYARRTGQGNFMGWIVNHPSTGLFSFGGAFAHYALASDPFYKKWPDNDLRKSLWDRVNFGLGDSTLTTRKFPDPNSLTQADAGMDFPIYRYAEVLYLFAEADARVAGGPTSEAMEAVNQVRRRAYGEEINAPSPADFDMANYNLDSFIDLIIQERGYEFIFEAKRWFTLKRTGKASEILLENRGITIPEKHYLWPIPNSELNFNDAINAEHQNPGY